MEKIFNKYIAEAIYKSYLDIRQKYSQQEADQYIQDKIIKIGIDSRILRNYSFKDFKESTKENTIF